MDERTNAQWLDELADDGPHGDPARSALRAVMLGGLRRALGGRRGVDDASLEDWAQDALLKVLGRLDRFRGESRFTTWAVSVAVRVALTELRRARSRDVSLDGLRDDAGAPSAVDPVDPSDGPERQAQRDQVLDAVRRVLDHELTERQRLALQLELDGVPQAEILGRLGTNRNALYKLTHDARKRLRERLLASGITDDDVRSAFDV